MKEAGNERGERRPGQQILAQRKPAEAAVIGIGSFGVTYGQVIRWRADSPVPPAWDAHSLDDEDHHLAEKHEEEEEEADGAVGPEERGKHGGHDSD